MSVCAGPPIDLKRSKVVPLPTAFRSARRCVCWLGLESPRTIPVHKRISTGARPWPAPGGGVGMLGGAGIPENDPGAKGDIDWSQTGAGPWLAETFAALRPPGGLARI